MIRRLLTVVIFLFFILIPVDSTAQAEIRRGYCELKGSVYITEYPGQADFLIYEEDSEAFADMLIFETDNTLFADRNGIWYFAEKEAFADFTVYFVDSKNNADFTVYFTSFESFAGCTN